MTDKTGYRVFLYAGIGLLLTAFSAKWLGVSMCYFWILLAAAITSKITFLMIALRRKSVRPGLWLYLILAGIAMILASLLFKHIFPMPLVRNILFFGAIFLKVTGLALMLAGKEKPE
jgi:hypothetical protein